MEFVIELLGEIFLEKSVLIFLLFLSETASWYTLLNSANNEIIVILYSLLSPKKASLPLAYSW